MSGMMSWSRNKNVNEVLGDESLSERDESLRDRIEHAIGILLAYSKGLKEIRLSPENRTNEYNYGM